MADDVQLTFPYFFQAGQPLEDEYPPLTPYQPEPEPEKKEVYLMEVRGLPWSCSVQDLLQFFSGEQKSKNDCHKQGRHFVRKWWGHFFQELNFDHNYYHVSIP